MNRVLWIPASLALAAALAGCGNEDKSRPVTEAEDIPGVTSPADRTGLVEYALVKTFATGLEKLNGIALDASGRIYAAGLPGVAVMDNDGNAVTRWRTPEEALCIATAPDGKVLIGLKTKVLTCDGTGAKLASWGTAGNGPGELGYVTGIAVTDENVFVADSMNRCVHRFTASGSFINEIGRRDDGAKFLGLIASSPYIDCFVDSKGKLVVNNPGQSRVETYEPDGKLLSWWGTYGLNADKFSGCCNPVRIAPAPEGNVLTSEKGIPRVKVYSRDGKMLAFIGPKFFTREAAGLDVAADSRGRIYVSDPGDRKIRVFAPKAAE